MAAAPFDIPIRCGWRPGLLLSAAHAQDGLEPEEGSGPTGRRGRGTGTPGVSDQEAEGDTERACRGGGGPVRARCRGECDERVPEGEARSRAAVRS